MSASVNAVKNTDKDDLKNLNDNSNPAKELSLEDLAPEGGWGWMVVAGMSLIFIMVLGPAPSFGIIFGDLLNANGNAGSASTFIHAMTTISFSSSGLVTNMLLKKYSMRAVGLYGALIFVIPNILKTFVRYVYELALISFLQGFGIGIMISVTHTNFNAYFVKRRAQVLTASHVINGIAGIAYPMCVNMMLDTYGFRGTSALIGAMSLHCVFGIITMHPVQWHARKPEDVLKEMVGSDERNLETDDSMADIIAQENEGRRHSMDLGKAPRRRHSAQSLKEHEVPLMVGALKASHQRVLSHSDVEAAARPHRRTESSQDLLKKRILSLSAASLSSITGIGVIGAPQRQAADEEIKVSDTTKKQKAGLMSILGDFFEVALLKDAIFVNICVGINIIMSTHMTFFSLFPFMMFSFGYSKSDVALAITVGAVAELASKLVMMIFTIFFKVKARYMFLVGSVCMAIWNIGFLYCNSLNSILAMVALMAFTRSWIFICSSLIIADHCDVDKFTAAYGLYIIFHGVIGVLIGPFVGFIRDLTNSYIICQYVLLGINLFCIVPWTVEILVMDVFSSNKKKSGNQK